MSESSRVVLPLLGLVAVGGIIMAASKNANAADSTEKPDGKNTLPDDKPNPDIFDVSANDVVYFRPDIQKKLIASLSSYYFMPGVNDATITIKPGTREGYENALGWAIRQNSKNKYLYASRWIHVPIETAKELVALETIPNRSRLNGDLAVLALPNQIINMIQSMPKADQDAIFANLPGDLAAVLKAPQMKQGSASNATVPGNTSSNTTSSNTSEVIKEDPFDSNLPTALRDKIKSIDDDFENTSSNDLLAMADEFSKNGYKKTAAYLKKRAAEKKSLEKLEAIDKGGYEFTILEGHLPYKVSEWFTGSPNRVKEMFALNPKDGIYPAMEFYRDEKNVTQVRGWTEGRKAKIPASWDISKGPPPRMPTPVKKDD